MSEKQEDRPASAGEPSQAGKRYACSKCGSEVLVTRGGSSPLKCCGDLMQRK